MKILYGVQGTGNGHTSRARIMAKALQQRDDVAVDYLFSGRQQDKYFDMQVFADYSTRTGISFVSHNGAVDHWQTIKALKLRQFYQDVQGLDLSGYDLVINDFEPVSAWAARLQNVPSISISHQAAFCHTVPKKGDTWLDRFIMKHFAPCDINLGVHWYHFGYDILPPFIDEDSHSASGQSHILVYLPFESLEEIQLLLEPLTEINFFCFHPDVTQDEDAGHIKWRKTCKHGFKQGLYQCAGVVANGGFELSSECLQLGKKLLIKPLHGQFEQLSNALTLTQLGLCQTMDTLETEKVELWLNGEQPKPVHFPKDPQPLIDWILLRQWHDTKSLCSDLWQRVTFPEEVQYNLKKYTHNCD